jgi:hypothetical protein
MIAPGNKIIANIVGAEPRVRPKKILINGQKESSAPTVLKYGRRDYNGKGN